MSNKEVKLRGKATRRSGPYPLGEIPDSVVIAIGRQLVHRLAVGHTNITGDDFGDIFANAIGGHHKNKPLGIADVEWNGCAWSCKTVQATKPFTKPSIRAISGRNNIRYSCNIHDVFADIQASGRAVLEIWNARVNEALSTHDDLRILVFVRNFSSLEFTIFEQEAVRFIPNEYTWTRNDEDNLEAHDSSGVHRFTWQTEGKQFTIIHHIPAHAYKFRIVRKPQTLEVHAVLTLVKFEENWIKKV